MFSAAEEKLINLYKDLVRSNRRTLESIPSKYREEVEKRIIAKVIAAAAPGGTGSVKVQWAETVKAGDPLYTADMIVATAETTIDDPMSFNFAFKLKGDITSSTQA